MTDSPTDEDIQRDEQGGWFDADGNYHTPDGGYYDPDGNFWSPAGGHFDPAGNYFAPDGSWYDADGLYHPPGSPRPSDLADNEDSPASDQPAPAPADDTSESSADPGVPDDDEPAPTAAPVTSAVAEPERDPVLETAGAVTASTASASAVSASDAADDTDDGWVDLREVEANEAGRAWSASEPTQPADPEDAPKPVKTAIEWAAIIIGAFTAALIIKTYLFQAFFIPTASMLPTLDVQDRVLVNKLSYRLHDINRGDLVVFERPLDAGGDPSVRDLIKRVIALPGETVESRDGRVVIDGRFLDEPYLPDGLQTTGIEKQTIPEGFVFVMGDNRTDSRDSRSFGPISEDLVVGRAFVRVWPLDNIDFL